MGWLARHSGSSHAADFVAAWCRTLAWCTLSACTTSGTSELDASDGARDAAAQHSGLPALCARSRSDAVRDVFCASERPAIESLGELFALLELTPAQPLETPTLVTTVGFGDVYAAGQGARALATVQMVFNLLYLGTALRLLSQVRPEVGPPSHG